MTNQLALILGALLLIAVALDLVTGFGASLFLARKFVELLQWVAFWR
jgi:hypothetical protein